MEGEGQAVRTPRWTAGEWRQFSLYVIPFEEQSARNIWLVELKLSASEVAREMAQAFPNRVWTKNMIISATRRWKKAKQELGL